MEENKIAIVSSGTNTGDQTADKFKEASQEVVPASNIEGDGSVFIPAHGDFNETMQKLASIETKTIDPTKHNLIRKFATGHQYTHTNPERNLKRQAIAAAGGVRQYKKKLREITFKDGTQ